MAEYYRFFDSTIDDIREYTADEYAEYFRMVLTNGIFNGGDNLRVTASGGDMSVDIIDGYAFINGYLYKVADGVNLTIETADTTYDRLDRIVLRWDKRDENRFIKAFVKKGVPAENPVAPTLTREEEVHELALATVRVRAGKNFIAGSNVTDERLNTEVCGLINSQIQADTTEIFNQFQSWFNEKTVDFKTQWDNWFAGQSGEGLIPYAEKGVPNGVATLDENGKVPSSQVFIPEMVASNVTISDTSNSFTSTTVEGALQELATEVKGAKTTLITNVNAILGM